MIKRILKYIARRLLFKIDRYVNLQWYDFPFGREPKADKSKYKEIAIKSAKAEYPEIDNFDLSSMHTIYYGSAPMPQALIKKALKKFGPIFTQYYGMGEAAPASMLFPWNFFLPINGYQI